MYGRKISQQFNSYFYWLHKWNCICYYCLLRLKSSRMDRDSNVRHLSSFTILKVYAWMSYEINPLFTWDDRVCCEERNASICIKYNSYVSNMSILMCLCIANWARLGSFTQEANELNKSTLKSRFKYIYIQKHDAGMAVWKTIFVIISTGTDLCGYKYDFPIFLIWNCISWYYNIILRRDAYVFII